MQINKKGGATSSFIDYTLAFVVTGIAFFCIITVILMYHGRDIRTEEIASEVYIAKIYFSPEMLLLEKDGVPQFGIIDIEKFSQEKIEKNNHYPEEQIGVQLRLVNAEGNPIKGFDAPNNILPEYPGAIYNNKDYFDANYAFAKRQVQLKGGATLHAFTYPVSLSTGESAFLEIIMVVANS